MAITTAAELQNLRVSLQHEFQEGYRSADPMDWMKVAMHIPDAWGDKGTYGFLGLWPDLAEWTGARVYTDLKEHDYTITNKAWANGVKIDRFKFQSDMRTGVQIYNEISRAYGDSAARFPEKNIFSLFSSGFTELCYDGQFFFDSDHPVYPKVDGTGTAVDTANVKRATATGTHTYWYLLDTRMRLKPFIYQEAQAPMFDSMMMGSDTEVFENNDYRFGVSAFGNFGFGLWQLAYACSLPLTAANVKTVYEEMFAYEADGNIPLGCMPNLLVTDPSLKFEALEVLKPQLTNGESNTLAGQLTALSPKYLPKVTHTV